MGFSLFALLLVFSLSHAGNVKDDGKIFVDFSGKKYFLVDPNVKVEGLEGTANVYMDENGNSDIAIVQTGPGQGKAYRLRERTNFEAIKEMLTPSVLYDDYFSDRVHEEVVKISPPIPKTTVSQLDKPVEPPVVSPQSVRVEVKAPDSEEEWNDFSREKRDERKAEYEQKKKLEKQQIENSTKLYAYSKANQKKAAQAFIPGKQREDKEISVQLDKFLRNDIQSAKPNQPGIPIDHDSSSFTGAQIRGMTREQQSKYVQALLQNPEGPDVTKLGNFIIQSNDPVVLASTIDETFKLFKDKKIPASDRTDLAANVAQALYRSPYGVLETKPDLNEKMVQWVDENSDLLADDPTSYLLTIGLVKDARVELRTLELLRSGAADKMTEKTSVKNLMATTSSESVAFYAQTEMLPKHVAPHDAIDLVAKARLARLTASGTNADLLNALESSSNQADFNRLKGAFVDRLEHRITPIPPENLARFLEIYIRKDARLPESVSHKLGGYLLAHYGKDIPADIEVALYPALMGSGSEVALELRGYYVSVLLERLKGKGDFASELPHAAKILDIVGRHLEASHWKDARSKLSAWFEPILRRNTYEPSVLSFGARFSKEVPSVLSSLLSILKKAISNHPPENPLDVATLVAEFFPKKNLDDPIVIENIDRVAELVLDLLKKVRELKKEDLSILAQMKSRLSKYISDDTSIDRPIYQLQIFLTEKIKLLKDRGEQGSVDEAAINNHPRFGLPIGVAGFGIAVELGPPPGAEKGR